MSLLKLIIFSTLFGLSRPHLERTVHQTRLEKFQQELDMQQLQLDQQQHMLNLQRMQQLEQQKQQTTQLQRQQKLQRHQQEQLQRLQHEELQLQQRLQQQFEEDHEQDGIHQSDHSPFSPTIGISTCSEGNEDYEQNWDSSVDEEEEGDKPLVVHRRSLTALHENPEGNEEHEDWHEDWNEEYEQDWNSGADEEEESDKPLPLHENPGYFYHSRPSSPLSEYFAPSSSSSPMMFATQVM